LFVEEVYAMAASSGGAQGRGSMGLLALLPWLLIFLIIYLLILRPQQQKQRRHQEMIDSLKKGDRVVTVGGIHGTIIGIKEKEGIVVLKVGDDVKLEVSKQSIARLKS